MTTVTDRPRSATPVRSRRSPARWLADNIILIVGIGVLIYTFVPIAYVMGLSVNEPSPPPRESVQYTWKGFTLDSWRSICEPQGMCDALQQSLLISLVATIGATILGTLMAFALVRHTFRGRTASNLVIFLPMATPEVVMGSSLLALFVGFGLDGSLGFITVVIAHIMFCLSFVVVTVKARLAGMDDRLEQAAMDLYANEWQTFRLVTLPLAMPGIVAAALLSFSLSFDDFIVTQFTSGQVQTFPLFVWGSAQRGGLPPQLFVIGSIMFFVSLLIVVGGELRRQRRPSY